MKRTPETTIAPDFAGLPLIELVGNLRAFTLAQLERLLSGQRPASFVAQLKPELLTVIQPPPQPALRAWPHRLIVRTPFTDYKAMVNAVTHGRMRAAEFHRWVLEDLARRLGGSVPGRLPAQLLPLLESMAWSDLEFRYKVVASVRHYLHAQVLFAAADPIVITLNVPTLWLLTLAGPQSGLTSPSRLLPPSQSGVAAVWRLTTYAEPLIAAPEWAGFWDQFAIYTMLERWSDYLPAMSATTRGSLAALPVVLTRPLAGSSMPDRGTAKSELAAPRWRQSAPAWYAAYEKSYH